MDIFFISIVQQKKVTLHESNACCIFPVLTCALFKNQCVVGISARGRADCEFSEAWRVIAMTRQK